MGFVFRIVIALTGLFIGLVLFFDRYLSPAPTIFCTQIDDMAEKSCKIERSKFLRDSVAFESVSEGLYEELRTLDSNRLGFNGYKWSIKNAIDPGYKNTRKYLKAFLIKNEYKDALAWSRNEIGFYPIVQPSRGDDSCPSYQYEMVFTKNGTVPASDSPYWRYDRISEHWYVRSSESHL